MQLIKVIVSSDMTYMPEGDDGKSINRKEILKIQYFITEISVTEELLQQLEIDVIRCKGDWLQTSYNIHGSYIEFDINFLQFTVGFEDIDNHEDFLDGYQSTLTCINQCFKDHFKLVKYETIRIEGSEIKAIEDNNENEDVDLLNITIIEADLSEHPIIEELDDQKLAYEIINKRATLSNTGASSFSLAALIMVIGKATGGAIGTVAGKKLLKEIIEKYKGKDNLIEIDDMKIKLGKVKRDISSMLDVPVTIIDFYSITSYGDSVAISFVCRKGLELTLITANCNTRGEISYLNIEKPIL
ncbi:hypothetical protein [Paenibacillus xylanexedens]|uniref:Uncharacterized protein n=1 Tax=Paenibacillus xylanexedens TaxID=528191 RepID=A0ABS4RNF8_PAEXY|nr:hypothetical protein [Paenibacillus xylanexedens]MBP2244264.1 hypothetical protein [Paenibacillus xylanexedens]